MTPAELNEVARFWTEVCPDSREAQVIVGLQAALRESEARVVQMREDAARVADDAATQAFVERRDFDKLRAGAIATRIRALPSPASAPTPGPTTPDDDVLTARFRAVHERLDAVEMYLRPLGCAAGRKP